jgi:hypothetical protein
MSIPILLIVRNKITLHTAKSSKYAVIESSSHLGDRSEQTSGKFVNASACMNHGFRINGSRFGNRKKVLAI